MNIDKLKELASNASQMPWEPKPEDVPHSARWAFREAVRPEDVLALIEVAEKAKEIVAQYEAGAVLDSDSYFPEAIASARAALSRLHGGQG